MNNEVLSQCDLLESNLKALNMPFLLEPHLIKVVSAATYTSLKKSIDVQLIKDSLKLLHKKQGIFSDFRSYNELVVGCRISLNNNPEQYINDIIDVYKHLQKGKFFGSSYRALGATIIVDAGLINQADVIATRTEEILDAMRSKHPFLTTDQDTCFAVLLAMTGKNVDSLMEEIEAAYKILKKSFSFHDNAVYSLCQILTTYEGTYEIKCNKVIEIYEALKNAGVKYGKEYELASLASLINIDMDKNDLAIEIKETEKYLKSKSGFKMLDMPTHSRLLFAAMIVAAASKKQNANAETAAIQGTIATVIAQEAALMMAMVAVSTASAAANSHN